MNRTPPPVERREALAYMRAVIPIAPDPDAELYEGNAWRAATVDPDPTGDRR